LLGAPGTAIANGARSMVLLVKPLSLETASEFFLSCMNGSTPVFSLKSVSNTSLGHGVDWVAPDAEVNVNLSTDWQVIGMSKVSGAAAVRMHRRRPSLRQLRH
jgi:hypothetical protein